MIRLEDGSHCQVMMWFVRVKETKGKVCCKIQGKWYEARSQALVKVGPGFGLDQVNCSHRFGPGIVAAFKHIHEVVKLCSY